MLLDFTFKMHVLFSQNTTLLFNKSAVCFGYSIVAITRTIPSIQKEVNNTMAILVGDLGPITAL
jgi:hypothetical protein